MCPLTMAAPRILAFVLCSTVTAAVPVQYYDMPSPSVRSAVWPMMQTGVAPFKVCLTKSLAACRQAVLALSSGCCAVCGRHTVQCASFQMLCLLEPGVCWAGQKPTQGPAARPGVACAEGQPGVARGFGPACGTARH